MISTEVKSVDSNVGDVELIFKKYYSSLCYFASRYLHEEEIVEDLVQDVFITLLEKKSVFQTELHLRNFLYLAIRNACLNYIRSSNSKDKYVAHLAQEDNTENFQDKIILTEVYRELVVAVAGLPEECRKVFELCYFQGLDNEAAAAKLGLSINTIKAQKARGKKILKENLKDLFPVVLLFLDLLEKPF